jgi:hypothetical protein
LVCRESEKLLAIDGGSRGYKDKFVQRVAEKFIKIVDMGMRVVTECREKRVIAIDAVSTIP